MTVRLGVVFLTMAVAGLLPFRSAYVSSFFRRMELKGVIQRVPMDQTARGSRIACASRCTANSHCLSFAFRPGASDCRLYAERITPSDVNETGSTPYKLYWKLADRCPSGWNWVLLGSSSMCVAVRLTRLAWQDAHETCLQDGGHLIILKTRESFDLLLNYLTETDQRYSYYVGLRGDAIEGRFTWLDGSVMDAVIWANGYPHDYLNQDCGIANMRNITDLADLGLKNLKCHVARQYICQMPVP